MSSTKSFFIYIWYLINRKCANKNSDFLHRSDKYIHDTSRKYMANCHVNYASGLPDANILISSVFFSKRGTFNLT